MDERAMKKIKTGTWARQAAKFFGFLLVVVTVAMAISDRAGVMPWQMRLKMLLTTPQGWPMLAVVAAAALLYPWYGFTERASQADFGTEAERIIRSMEQAGFRLEERTEERMSFRAASQGLRWRSLFEDEIVIRPLGKGRIGVAGNRRLLATVNRRLYLNNRM